MSYACSKLLCAITVPLFLASCSGNPGNSYPLGSAAVSNTSRGEEIFRQRCIACHGLNGNYRKMNAADLQQSRLDSIGIVTTIKNGRGQMPMFKAVLSDSDLAQLEQYIMTLRK